MICKNCGAELHGDEEYCVNCGAAVEKEEAPVEETVNPVVEEKVENAVKTEPAKKFDIAKIAGIAVGVLLIIVGFSIMGKGDDYSSYLRSASFGADFYTYTYDGIVGVNRTIGTVNSNLAVIVKGIGWLLVGFGAFMDCHFLSKK